MPNLGRRKRGPSGPLEIKPITTAATAAIALWSNRGCWPLIARLTLCAMVLGSVCFVTAPVLAVEPLVSRAMAQDATLWAIDFVDQQRGWAVGDRGTIWHTNDGGNTWAPQRSPVACPLTGLDFLDARHGWAVGGKFDPHTHTSRGVILFTNDGGNTWTEFEQAVLPALRSIKMIDGVRGFAWGQPSGLYPSAVFSTDDSGRTWIPLSSAAVQSWEAADFIDAFNGAVAGQRVTMAAVRRRALEPASFPTVGPRHAKAIKLQAAGPGWLVGSGGLVLTTADQGRTWQLPPSPLPPAAYQQFDFESVTAVGPQCWIAGSPGSRILYTPDAGRTWHWLSTGQSLPIHDLRFVDAQHGYACGALGTILATNDGGRTWRRQRSGGTRLAVLALLGDQRGIGWELFAQAAAGEGYLSHIHLIGTPAAADPLSAQLPHRLHQASLAVGACGASIAWQFPLPADQVTTGPEQIVQVWDRLHQRQGLTRLEEHLVRQIRLWQPEVIVTHAATPAGADPLDHILSQVVVRAIDLAANPEQFPQQIEGAGLKPHEVKKVIGALPPGQAGDFTVATSQIVPRLAHSLVSMGEEARALLNESADVPNSWGFRLSHSQLPSDAARRDLMAGVILQPGGDARRTLDEAAGNTDRLRHVQQYQNVRNIIRRAEANPQQRAGLLSGWSQLTADLSPHAKGQLLFTLAQQHRAAGRWAEAAEVYHTLVRTHANHPTVPAAMAWLTHYYSSQEVAHWMASDAPAAGMQTAGGQTLPEPNLLPALAEGEGKLLVEKREGQIVLGQGQGQITIEHGQGAIVPGQANTPEAMQVVRAVAETPLNAVATGSPRLHQLVELANLLERRYPTLYAEPSLRLPLAAAMAREGKPEAVQHYCQLLLSTRPRDTWWRCAAAERWLAEQAGLVQAGAERQPPKPAVWCAPAAAKPYLDGKLDDEVWLSARPIELASPTRDDGEWGAVAYVAYDSEFLYLAATCRKAPNVEYPDTAAARPRDGDLSRQDRVEFFIDVDRDAATYYHLAIDHRGWPNDRCWGSKDWNPSWYIAVDKNEATWTVEAAIPLKELTSHTPAAGTVWSLGVQRIVPGVGFQSWTQPAAPTPRPEGFGLMLWQ